MNRIRTRELEDVRRLLERRHVPLDDLVLTAEGFGSSAAALSKLLGGLPPERALNIIDALLIERRSSQRTELDLVWTGPEASISTSRDTAVLVRELFSDATEHVLLAGFSFTDGANLFAPLHERMKQVGVRAEFFVDVQSESLLGESANAHANRWHRSFLASQWPFGSPFPTCYFHPAHAGEGHRSSLHAKCLVIDSKVALITSANFTRSGHTSNIELGVLIRDEDFARQIVHQWTSLVALKLVHRLS